MCLWTARKSFMFSFGTNLWTIEPQNRWWIRARNTNETSPTPQTSQWMWICLTNLCIRATSRGHCLTKRTDRGRDPNTSFQPNAAAVSRLMFQLTWAKLSKKWFLELAFFEVRLIRRNGDIYQSPKLLEFPFFQRFSGSCFVGPALENMKNGESEDTVDTSSIVWVPNLLVVNDATPRCGFALISSDSSPISWDLQVFDGAPQHFFLILLPGVGRVTWRRQGCQWTEPNGRLISNCQILFFFCKNTHVVVSENCLFYGIPPMCGHDGKLWFD